MVFKIITKNKFLYQYLASFTGCLCIISTGMHYGWPSPALPILLSPDSSIKISDEEGAMISTIQEYGNVVGAPLAAFIVDRIGRKLCILSSAPIFFIGWILMAKINSLSVVYACRFFAGVADGIIYTALPMYLGEITHPSVRGLSGTLFQVFFVFGSLMFNILGSLVSLRMATYIAASIPLIQILTFSFMPESPYYLVMRGKVDEAEASLKTLNNGEDISHTLKDITSAINEKKNEKPNRWEIFTEPSNRKAIYISFGLRLFQQFTGITALNFYIQEIFVELDVPMEPSTISIIYFGLQFIMCSLVSIVIDSTGRKPLLLYSFGGTALATITLASYFFWSKDLDLSGSNIRYIPISAMFFYIVIYNVGLASTPMLTLSEMFNARVKAVAICSADIFTSALIILVSMFFQFTKDNFGIYVSFTTFTIVSILGGLFVIYFVPETKGMTLEQIQDYLKGVKKEKIELA
ncbi:unnamed protein product [Brassicogethes aeneus]|uniref:Major facilitator superfamily (MFS) profile domain-containing protein n=1 Tax=Brassicogethes aeneus TaxID=1431903 RepID=A0A9P0AQ91_BRAAE|nr:unnamed protein product [Brassicogethes aeneus]